MLQCSSLGLLVLLAAVVTRAQPAVAGPPQPVAGCVDDSVVGAASSKAGVAGGARAAAWAPEAEDVGGADGGHALPSHLRRQLLSLHGELLPRLKGPLQQRGDARVRRVAELLASVGSLGAELRAYGDAWAAGRANVLSAASERVRGDLQPAAARLREALRERCSDAAFVPPTDKPAQIAGPGITLTLTGASCRLVRVAAPTRRDLVLSCTQPSASEAFTQPRYTSAYTAGATFSTSECKTDRQFGLGGTVSVDLWQPGSRPQDAVDTWRQVAGRLRQQTADAADRARGRSEAVASRLADAVGASGVGAGNVLDGGSRRRATPLQRLLRPHSAMARALRLALSKNRDRLASAMAAWMAAHEEGGAAALLQQSAPAGAGHGTAPRTSSAAQQGPLRVGQAVAALLRDLGLEGAAGQLLQQLGMQPAADGGVGEQEQDEMTGRGADGEPPQRQTQQLQGSNTTAGQQMQQSGPGGGGEPGAGGEGLAGGVAGVFDLVEQEGLQTLRAQLARLAAEAGAVGTGADGVSGTPGGAGRSGIDGEEEVGGAASKCAGGGSSKAVMQRVAAELARLAQM